MQHLIQKALRDKLLTSSTLVTFLTAGKSSPHSTAPSNMYAEGDVEAQYPAPYVVFVFGRQRMGVRKNEFIQTWQIRVYNRDKGYYDIENMQTEIFNALHDSDVVVDVASPLFCLPQGIQYVSSIRGYDNKFKTEYVAAIVDVHLMRRNAS